MADQERGKRKGPGRERSGTGALLSMRVPPQFKDRLEDAAKKNYRTLSQEVQHRIERSFDPGSMMVDALNALGPVRNPLGASPHVRTVTSAIYGDEIGDLGWWFMTNLALVRTIGQSGTKVKLKREDIDRLKAAVQELEAHVDTTDKPRR